MKIEIDKLKATSKTLEGKCSGIYFLFDGEELVYIGKGWNCFLGVGEATRKESDKEFTSWGFIPIDDVVEYKALAKELIKKHAPKYNKTHKSA